MKVVVCDDSAEDLKIIKGLLEKYEKKNESLEFEIRYFTGSVELYHQIQLNERSDIYILDMIMAHKTGIDLGALIHSMDARSAIIYITSSDDFAFEAYGVHAVRYLLKPVREELFFEALDYAACILPKTGDEVYTVKTKEGVVAVPYSKIEYIENYSRRLNVCLTDGRRIKSIYIRKSFDEEIRQIAENGRFVQVHKSFLVNLRYVDKLAPDNALMESGTKIPVSKTRAADVKKKYLQFVSKQYL